MNVPTNDGVGKIFLLKVQKYTATLYLEDPSADVLQTIVREK
jgi:hypothetical protein